MASGRGGKLKKALEILARTYGKEGARNPGSSPLDHLVYGILAGNGPQQKARKAFHRLEEAFVDRNELRVATTQEVVEHLKDLASADETRGRADQLLRTLQGLYDALDRVRIDLESEDDEREVARALNTVPGLSPGLAAAVVARARPEPPIRLSSGISRVAQRTGILPRSGGEAKLSAALASAAGGGEGRVLVHLLLTEHAERVCVPKNPDCPNCPLVSHCDYGKKKTSK